MGTAALAFAGVSAFSQYRAGQAQAAQLKAQAQQYNLEARQQAIIYKQQAADVLARLNEHLSTTIATAAASGIQALEGSALSLQNYAISEAANEYATARDNELIATQMGKFKADVAKSGAKSAMQSGLLNAGASLAMGYYGYKQAGQSSLLNSSVPGGGQVGLDMRSLSTTETAAV
tara:strand:- start:8044 stop:8571 length:528 start_codon:yes stop_codon:yes gene_type:complete